jgi:hypothetical protein
LRLARTENSLQNIKNEAKNYEEFISDMRTVSAAYLETESDILQYPDKEKRKKMIRHKLYNQIAQKISKNFNHKMDMERSESGRTIYSYTFLTKRI